MWAWGARPPSVSTPEDNAAVAERCPAPDSPERKSGCRRELSGGERQRVALARVLVRDRPVLLLDEPFASLGPALKDDMLDLVAAFHAEKRMTVLFVTHQPEDARSCRAVVFLENGRVAAAGMRRLFSRRRRPRRFAATAEMMPERCNGRRNCPEADINCAQTTCCRHVYGACLEAQSVSGAATEPALASIKDRKGMRPADLPNHDSGPAAAGSFGAGLRRLRAAALLVLATGCQGLNGAINEPAFQPSDKPVTVDNAGRNDRLAALARSQHPRILATYGGEYSDPKLERMVAKVVGKLTTDSGNPSADLSHHHSQFAQRQCLRAARRLSLCHARLAGVGQRLGRACCRHLP